jgi:hypothetical protein
VKRSEEYYGYEITKAREPYPIDKSLAFMRVDTDRRDAKLGRSTRDSGRNFTTIGCHEFLEGRIGQDTLGGSPTSRAIQEGGTKRYMVSQTD